MAYILYFIKADKCVSIIVKKKLFVYIPQGWIQDFKLGGGAFEKIVPSGGRHEHFWCISCEKSLTISGIRTHNFSGDIVSTYCI
jgi:hypothetical protein